MYSDIGSRTYRRSRTHTQVHTHTHRSMGTRSQDTSATATTPTVFMWQGRQASKTSHLAVPQRDAYGKSYTLTHTRTHAHTQKSTGQAVCHKPLTRSGGGSRSRGHGQGDGRGRRTLSRHKQSTHGGQQRPSGVTGACGCIQHITSNRRTSTHILESNFIRV